MARASVARRAAAAATRCRRRVCVVVFAATMLAGGPAAAGPTGLAVIPTTDLVRFRQLNVILQNGNTQIDGRHAFFHDVQPVPQLEAGLPHDLEAGVDVAPADPPRDYRPFFNVKWTMLAESYRVPAVAVGATQLGRGRHTRRVRGREQDAQFRCDRLPEVPRPPSEPPFARHPRPRRLPRSR